MADDKPAKKTRRLRQATQTVRQRAEKANDVQPKRRLRVSVKAPSFVGAFLRRVGGLKIWRPFKFIGRHIIPPYLRRSFSELRLVTWPDGKQTRQLTSAVILFSVIFGILVAIFDFGLDKVFKAIITK